MSNKNYKQGGCESMKKASETLRAIGDNPNVLMIGGAIALIGIIIGYFGAGFFLG